MLQGNLLNFIFGGMLSWYNSAGLDKLRAVSWFEIPLCPQALLLPMIFITSLFEIYEPENRIKKQSNAEFSA